MWLTIWGFIKPHLFYWILGAGALFAFHTWLNEHDARLLAENQIKQLQNQIAIRDTQSQKQVTTIIKEVAAAKTPQQQIAEIPRISDVPLNAKLNLAVDGQPPTAQVDLASLVEELSQCKQDSIKLDTCQKDIQDLQTAVKVSQKKPGFWHQLVHDAKNVGIGVAIGAGTSAILILRR